MNIVIAPRKMHRSLLSLLREKDPFLNVKLVSKEQLSKLVYPSVKEEALIYLMKEHHLTYEVANMLVEFIPYVSSDSDNHKLHQLFELRKELIEKDMLFFPLEDSSYKNVTADIYGYYEEDKELKDILAKLNISPIYNKNSEVDRSGSFYEFDKVEEETYFVLNEIASLIDKGININNIYIYKRHDIYDYYLNKFAPLFGYKINLLSNDKFISLGGSKEFFKLYGSNKNIDLSLSELKSLMKEDPSYFDIEDIVLNNKLEDVSFELQYDYLLNKFNEKSLPRDKYTNAVNVINSGIAVKDKYIFVMGFAQGQFPKSKKDDKYLNGNELKLIDRLNVKEQTKLDKLSILDFIYSDNHLIFSYSKKSIKEKFFPSPLINDLKLEKAHTHLPAVFYSDQSIKYIYSNLKDLETFYKERGVDFLRLNNKVDIEYRNYDSSFKSNGKKLYKKDSVYLSTTQLDLYDNCPYHYYLSRVLELDEDEETFALTLGNIAHYMFEHYNDENFDFEKEFAAKINEKPIKSSEKILLEGKLKQQIKLAVEVIKKREQYMSNPCSFKEEKVTLKIDEHTAITGRIDYLAVIDDKYVICIDYKTGDTKFNDKKLEYGVYTQLPTYALLIGKSDKFKDYQIAGIYLNNVINKSITEDNKEESLIPDYLKLNGKTINELEIVSKIDSTIADKKSSFIRGIGIKKDGGLSANSGLISQNEFESYKDIATNLYKEASNGIRSDRFNIYPLYISSSDNACQYCPFKDICHVKEIQFNKVQEEVDEDE